MHDAKAAAVNERNTSPRARKLVVPVLFGLFIIALGSAAMFIVLNPNQISAHLPDKGQPTISPR